MSKHTPKPWLAKFGIAGEGHRSIYGRAFDGLQKYICEKVHGGSPAEAEANARLIAAAPDLLEALKAVVDLSGVGHEDPDCPEDDTCRCSTITLVNSALRKAEGRESER